MVTSSVQLQHFVGAVCRSYDFDVTIVSDLTPRSQRVYECRCIHRDGRMKSNFTPWPNARPRHLSLQCSDAMTVSTYKHVRIRIGRLPKSITLFSFLNSYTIFHNVQVSRFKSSQAGHRPSQCHAMYITPPSSRASSIRLERPTRCQQPLHRR